MSGVLYQRLRANLARSGRSVSRYLQQLLGGGVRLDEATLQQMEEILIAADVGVETSLRLITAVRERARGGKIADAGTVLDWLADEIRRLLEPAADSPAETRSKEGTAATGTHDSLRVVLFVGVNGTGKTTTVAKLAKRWRDEGRSVVLAAADTFRAAAAEQLETWANRIGVELIRQQAGADPAAVVFDAIQAARARKRDAVLIDTAGRLHNKANLMAELRKIGRVCARGCEGAPHEVLLVIDATTGQNGLAQAVEFTQAVDVTGIVLTKLDGSAKGGIVLAIRERLGLPVKWVGLGEGVDDLVPFDAGAFVDALLDRASG